MEFFTIGVFNSTEESFFNKLTLHAIDTFCDIRQRRGVRGVKYAYVNSIRLQKRLLEFGIKYTHVCGLAPTNEVRVLQKEADAEKKDLKRSRNQLDPIFIASYNSTILSHFDFEQFIEQLDLIGANRIALFCVEEAPGACHRSLVAKKLKENFQVLITDL